MNKKLIGVIDIGSNSVRLIVAWRDRFKSFRILEDIKVNVRLGEGMSDTGRLSEDRMCHGVETLILFKQVLNRYGITRAAAVATAAVRKAENGLDFVRRVQEATGIEVQVISGREEASLDYLGAMNTLEIRDAVLMDIGGGSMELVRIQDRRQVDAISIPVGAVDLTERFDLRDRPDKKKTEALEKALKETFSQVDFLQKAKGLPVIGVGGTIRNIGRIHRRMTDYPIDKAHHYQMDADAVKTVYKTAAEMDLEARKTLKGLSKGRADVFVGAACAVRELMAVLNSKALIISEAGLREGLILRCFGEDQVDEGGVFDTALMNAAQHYRVNLLRAAKVDQWMLQLFDILKPLHDIQREVRRIIKISAMLRNAGVRIEYSHYQEHSAYLILNTALYGVTHQEILMSALTVFNHKSAKKIRVDASYLKLLDEDELWIIEVLSLLLQMADSLEKASTAPGSVRILESSKDQVELLLGGGIDAHFAGLITLECGKKFKRLFDRELKLTVQR